MARRRLVAVAALSGLMLVSLLLTGCSMGGNVPDPTAEPTIPPASTIVPTPTMSIGEVIWAVALDDEGVPVEALSQVSRNAEVIYAVAELQAVPPGTSFTAEWTINGQQIEGKAETIEIEEGAATGWIAFSLTWTGEALWPVSELGVTITANSGEMATGAVRIVSG